jgi:acyl-CoA thioesterase FadM
MLEELFGVSYAELLEVHQVGYPVVQVATEFKRPAHFGAKIAVEVFLSRLTPRSGTFEYRLRDASSAELLATASVKVVAMTLGGHGPTVFPERVQAGLAPYLEQDDQGPDTARIR